MSKKRDISVSTPQKTHNTNLTCFFFTYKREEIAKQFLLPERQSKIDTLLKQDGQAYCLCRSSDSSRFMIACDACEEWYHGDCINISEKEAKHIRQYFCPRCCEEDPTLQTRWRSRKDDKVATTTTNREEHQQQQQQRVKKRKERPEKSDKKTKRCGDCMGCYRTEDCGRCDVCTRKKSTGSRQKERCKQRICVNYGGYEHIFTKKNFFCFVVLSDTFVGKIFSIFLILKKSECLL